jgi:hypothetical protein
MFPGASCARSRAYTFRAVHGAAPVAGGDVLRDFNGREMVAVMWCVTMAALDG